MGKEKISGYLWSTHTVQVGDIIHICYSCSIHPTSATLLQPQILQDFWKPRILAEETDLCLQPFKLCIVLNPCNALIRDLMCSISRHTGRDRVFSVLELQQAHPTHSLQATCSPAQLSPCCSLCPTKHLGLALGMHPSLTTATWRCVGWNQGMGCSAVVGQWWHINVCTLIHGLNTDLWATKNMQCCFVLW